MRRRTVLNRAGAALGVAIGGVTTGAATTSETLCEVIYQRSISSGYCSGAQVSDDSSYVIVRLTTVEPAGGDLWVETGNGSIFPCPLMWTTYHATIDSTVTEIHIDDPSGWVYYTVDGQPSGTLEIIECV